MKCLSKSTKRVDIIVSHDWPVGIEQHGNTQELIRMKPFFRQEIEQNNLGSPPNREVLDAVKPAYWFSAHLHVKFLAKVTHPPIENRAQPKSDEDAPIHLVPSQVRIKPLASPLKGSPKNAEQQGSNVPDDTIDSDSKAPPLQVTSQENDNQKETIFHGLESTCDGINSLTEQMTRFLALDKCLPRRKYLSILHIDVGDRPTGNTALEFDPEWLAVLRKTHHLNSVRKGKVYLPDDVIEISAEDIEWVDERLRQMNSKRDEADIGSTYRAISTDFQPTVPFYSDPMFQSRNMCPPFPQMGNPQTDFLLDLLELDHSLTHPYDAALTPQMISELLRPDHSGPRILSNVADENEIDLELDEGDTAMDENDIEVSQGEEVVEGRTPPDASHNTRGPSEPQSLPNIADENEIELEIDDGTKTDENEIEISEQDELANHAVHSAGTTGSSTDEAVTKKARIDE